MKTFCFLNNKGGVGKTATVTTIGHMMATVYGKRVLIVDLDPQHNTSARFSENDWLSIFLSIYQGTNLDKEDYSVEDILLDSELDVHKAIKKTKYEGMDIIPSYLTLATKEDMLKADVTTPQQFRLKKQLKKLQDEYDYCLIDCSPSISILNVNALVASDEVYLPVRTDGDSCIGLAISLNLVKTVQEYNPTLRVGGCFLTQCNWKENVAKTTYDLLKQILPDDMILPIQIGNSKYLRENSYEQKPLLSVDSGKNKSSVTLAYLKLTEYLMAANKKEYLKNEAEEIAKLNRFGMVEIN